MYEYQPSILDVQLLNAWLTVMEAAHLRLPEAVGLELLPKLYSCSLGCLLAEKTFLKRTAVSLMKVEREGERERERERERESRWF